MSPFFGTSPSGRGLRLAVLGHWEAVQQVAAEHRVAGVTEAAVVRIRDLEDLKALTTKGTVVCHSSGLRQERLTTPVVPRKLSASSAGPNRRRQPPPTPIVNTQDAAGRPGPYPLATLVRQAIIGHLNWWVCDAIDRLTLPQPLGPVIRRLVRQRAPSPYTDAAAASNEPYIRQVRHLDLFGLGSTSTIQHAAGRAGIKMDAVVRAIIRLHAHQYLLPARPFEVAWRLGYNDPSTLQRLLQRHWAMRLAALGQEPFERSVEVLLDGLRPPEEVGSTIGA